MQDRTPNASQSNISALTWQLSMACGNASRPGIWVAVLEGGPQELDDVSPEGVNLSTVGNKLQPWGMRLWYSQLKSLTLAQRRLEQSFKQTRSRPSPNLFPRRAGSSRCPGAKYRHQPLCYDSLVGSLARACSGNPRPEPFHVWRASHTMTLELRSKRPGRITELSHSPT